jgi:plasmid stabilization system protein ParE
MLPGILDQERPELLRDLRSFPFHNYVIFFCDRGDRLEVINILEGYRDIGQLFSGK